jgi:hypothetical protein
MFMVVNNTFETRRNLMLEAKLISISGKVKPITSLMVEVGPSLTQKYFSVQERIFAATKEQGGFLSLALRNKDGKIESENIYWYPDSTGNYSGLQTMPVSRLQITAREVTAGKLEVVLSNPPGAPLAFFNRLSIIDTQTKKRALPVFYTDNYLSVMPGESRTVYIDLSKIPDLATLKLAVRGWNLKEQLIEITTK